MIRDFLDYPEFFLEVGGIFGPHLYMRRELLLGALYTIYMVPVIKPKSAACQETPYLPCYDTLALITYNLFLWHNFYCMM